ncbi:oligosaccharide flippase family protein [Pseudomonas sp. PDM20]|uniref:oligosaccharide flippase family protein n=1 Tax=Pseudomonas sp. PDM20 TaxID=2769254 RepID=UPI0017864130|nr:oligosaccharide flippase family protein [Pseudomonas sp. PDM20]MBD9683206.1 oligosaccharide flippase family protein [Pseudomonas sp. PDM20]
MIAFLYRGILAASGFIISTLLARFTSIAEFGNISIYANYISFAIPIITCGASTQIIKSGRLHQNVTNLRASRYAFVAVLLSLISLAPTYLLSKSVYITSLISIVIITTSLCILKSDSFRSRLNFRAAFLLGNGNASVGYFISGILPTAFFTAAICIVHLFKPLTIERIFLLAIAANLVALFIYRLEKIEIPSKKWIKKAIKIGIPNITIITLLSIISAQELIIIKTISNTETVAAYAISIRLSSLLLITHTIFSSLCQPYFSIIHRKSSKDKLKELSKYSKITLTILIIPLLIYGKTIISTLFGPNYEATVEINAFNLKLVSIYIYGVLGFNISELILSKRPRNLMYLCAICACIYPASTYILYYSIDLSAQSSCAISFSISFTLLSLGAKIMNTRKINHA